MLDAKSFKSKSYLKKVNYLKHTFGETQLNLSGKNEAGKVVSKKPSQVRIQMKSKKRPRSFSFHETERNVVVIAKFEV